MNKKLNGSIDRLAAALRDVVKESAAEAVQPLREEIQSVREEMQNGFAQVNKDLAEVRGELAFARKQGELGAP